MSYLFFLALMLPFILGFLYHCRGGFIALGSTFLARLVFWALPIALVILPISWMWAIPCGMLAYLGLLIPHAWAQADTKPLHIVGMAGIGLARLAMILVPLAVFNPWVELFSLAGLLSGLGYYIGHKWLEAKVVKLFGKSLTPDGAAWGELFTGFAYGLGFSGLYIFHALTSKISFIMRAVEFFI